MLSYIIDEAKWPQISLFDSWSTTRQKIDINESNKISAKNNLFNLLLFIFSSLREKISSFREVQISKRNIINVPFTTYKTYQIYTII